MHTRSHLSSFYASHSFPSFPVSDLHKRHIRFDADGRFIKLDRPQDQESLEESIVRIAPTHAYYSVSRWMNPHLLVPKERSVSITDNLFLGCDLVFDIDVKPFSEQNIERARIKTLRLYEHLKSRFHISYIALSGGKGFHLVFHDPVIYNEVHPLKREEEARNFRKTLVEELSEFEFDRKVTTDTRRVIRIPYTINSKSGYQCRPLTEEELRTSAKEILKNTPCVTISALETIRTSLTFVWDDLCSFACKMRTTPNAAPPRAGTAFSDQLFVSSFQSPVSSFQSYLSSSVLGAKNRHIPLLQFQNTPRMQVRIKEIQKKFNLGTIYLFSSDDEILAFTCDALQTQHVEKILQAAKSRSLLSYKKYLQGFFPLSFKTVSRTYPGISKHPQSKGHQRFLSSSFGCTFPEEGMLCGSDEYKIVDAVVER